MNVGPHQRSSSGGAAAAPVAGSSAGASPITHTSTKASGNIFALATQMAASLGARCARIGAASRLASVDTGWTSTTVGARSAAMRRNMAAVSVYAPMPPGKRARRARARSSLSTVSPRSCPRNGGFPMTRSKAEESPLGLAAPKTSRCSRRAPGMAAAASASAAGSMSQPWISAFGQRFWQAANTRPSPHEGSRMRRGASGGAAGSSRSASSTRKFTSAGGVYQAPCERLAARSGECPKAFGALTLSTRGSARPRPATPTPPRCAALRPSRTASPSDRPRARWRRDLDRGRGSTAACGGS